LHDELVRAAMAEPADFFYGGTSAALAATAEAASRGGLHFALDLEDFHSGEEPEPSLETSLASRVETATLSSAKFVSAASGAIAAEYRQTYGVGPVAVHNTFSLPRCPPDFARRSPRGALSLYWFSQTIGAGRGLEDAVRAVGLAEIEAALHLRGRPVAGYLDALRSLAAAVAPRLSIVHSAPAHPSEMIELCRPYDVGLSLEQPTTRHRELCLTNKALTYPLAGLAQCTTDTAGQRELAHALGLGALVYRPGDLDTLAAGLRQWADDSELLRLAKQAAWRAAHERWHWDHPCEKGALVSGILGAIRA